MGAYDGKSNDIDFIPSETGGERRGKSGSESSNARIPLPQSKKKQDSDKIRAVRASLALSQTSRAQAASAKKTSSLAGIGLLAVLVIVLLISRWAKSDTDKLPDYSTMSSQISLSETVMGNLEMPDMLEEYLDEHYYETDEEEPTTESEIPVPASTEATEATAFIEVVTTTTTVTTTTSTKSNELYPEIKKSGEYSSRDEVAKYIVKYGKLPGNYITKNEAKKLGWVSSEGNLWDVAPDKSIGGDRFGNYEGILPQKSGVKYYECDIDYSGGWRNSLRIIYSNKGAVYYTSDHYESFVEFDKESGTWK